MSSNRGKKAPPAPGKKASAKRAAPPPAEVRPISPLGLIGAIAAALVIAAILLFVINSRINAARPATTPVVAQPTAVQTGSGQTPATSTQVSGFSKGNAQAKVTVTEFGDFK